MVKKISLILCAFLLSVQAYAVPLLKYETFTLKNGLQFILMVNKRAPIVSYTTWFKVGSADEIKGKTGLAHYLEHIMEDAYPEVQMGQFLEDYNASNMHANAFTSHDYTCYYRMVTTPHLELIMRFEAGRMRGVAFNQDKFDTEKNVILEERLMRTENDPDALFSEKINSQFFKEHPYKNPIIGLETDIKNLTLEDAKDFHNKWYHTNNAVIIVSGDFDPAQVKTWAETYYGDIAPGPAVNRKRIQDPYPFPKMETIVVEHPRATLITFNEIFKLKPRTPENYNDFLALYLLSEYFNGDQEGSLEEIIVHKEKLATTFLADCSFYQNYDSWSFIFIGSTNTEENVQKIRNIIHKRLQDIQEKGLSEDDLKRARKYVYNHLVMNLDGIYERAKYLGYGLTSGVTPDQMNTLPDSLEGITSADIQHVIKEYLTEEKSCLGVLKKPSSPRKKGGQ